MDYKLITVLGPTAVGKTRLSALLADYLGSEIISADSRQVYRGMDIGTGKDLDDYLVGDKLIKYHLIDIIDPDQEFNLFDFNSKFFEIFNKLEEKKILPILAGGTGLYIHSILKGYEFPVPENCRERIGQLEHFTDNELINKLSELKNKIHNTTDLIDRNRIIKAILIEEARNAGKIIKHKKVNSLVIGINPGREIIKQRITTRLKTRLKNGMIEEVENLINSGVSIEKLEFFGLEYRYLSQYLSGRLNYNDMYQKLNSAIHDFAKRQMTFFRKMEKEGIEINWFDNNNFNEIKDFISERIEWIKGS